MSKNINLEVNIAGLKFKNPVISASGTFAFGREFADFYDLSRLGGIATKAITVAPRKGNKPPRIAETPAGAINSIGLQNPGVDVFLAEHLPYLRQFDTCILANISGSTMEEYCILADKLKDTAIDAFELNVSCPNVKEGCMAFGNTPEGISEITRVIKSHCGNKPLIVKLTPNAPDLVGTAVAAEKAGADALSLINTIRALAIDIHKMRPIIANNIGGLAGPAIKPIAVRMVYEVAQAVTIPIIGMGGIMNGDDAVEFMLAGASCVMVGTANLINPTACIDVIDGIESYLKLHGIDDVNKIINKLEFNKN